MKPSLSLLFAEINITLYALHYASEPLARWAVWQLFPLGWLQAWWQWPQTLLWLLCVSALVVFIKFLFSLRHIEAGLLGALTAFVLAINHTGNPYWYDLLMAGAALILCVAILLDSYHMAYRDELTGIPARRALNQHLLSLGSRYTIAMLDVDHFKKFNDTHGHDVGDNVLIFLVKTLRRRLRETDMLFRVGGEEFAVLLRDTHLGDAHLLAEQLRKKIETLNEKNIPAFTFSLGVTEYQDFDDQNGIVKRADILLYEAKGAGRNRVVAG